jgi:hypothetical protein
VNILPIKSIVLASITVTFHAPLASVVPKTSDMNILLPVVNVCVFAVILITPEPLFAIFVINTVVLDLVSNASASVDAAVLFTTENEIILVVCKSLCVHPL